MSRTQIIAFIILLTSISVVYAQEVILDSQSNRFLINAKGNQPRLDIIVQRFTDYERDVISKIAVMDTVTKPNVEKVSETEYNVSASRMGEKLTFVIRDFEKSGDNYHVGWSHANGKPGEELRADRNTLYRLNGELTVAVMPIPFTFKKIVVWLKDEDNEVVFKLNVNFSYPRPELIYVDITDGYGTTSWEDTSKIRRILSRVNLVPTTYSNNNSVPDHIVIRNDNLFFRFKKAYYDGAIRPASLFCHIDDRFLSKTPLELYPLADVQLLAHEDDWYILPSGKHTVYASYDGKNIPVYEFEMNKRWEKIVIHYLVKVSFLIMMILFKYPWILLLALGLVLFANWGNRLKKAREESQKLNLELQSIQSQLNPHFVFNALGSIQSLINRNEIESANNYLTDFSKLLRKSLNNNGKEMIPLSEELYVLDSYVKLEKLRFNFTYQLYIDDNLQVAQVEIPSLLIQPLVENAIKHGISALGEEGILSVSFSGQGNNLVVEIRDNGTGFNTMDKTQGKGLELTKERIKLLNRQKYHITMDLQSTKGVGTTVTLLFKHFC